MTDRLVQQHPVPAGAQDHVHFSGRTGDRVEIDQGLAQGLGDLVLPAFGGDPGLEAGSAAGARRAVLAAAVLLDGDLDVDAAERADVANQPTLGAEDLHHPPLAGQRDHHLGDARIGGAGIGVDLLQQGDLVGEAGRGERILVAVKLLVGGPGALAGDAAARPARLASESGVGGAADGGLRKVSLESAVPGRLAGHDPQAKAFGGVV